MKISNYVHKYIHCTVTYLILLLSVIGCFMTLERLTALDFLYKNVRLILTQIHAAKTRHTVDNKINVIHSKDAFLNERVMIFMQLIPWLICAHDRMRQRFVFKTQLLFAENLSFHFIYVHFIGGKIVIQENPLTTTYCKYNCVHRNLNITLISRQIQMWLAKLLGSYIMSEPNMLDSADKSPEKSAADKLQEALRGRPFARWDRAEDWPEEIPIRFRSSSKTLKKHEGGCRRL